jgi:hypothetical protein
LETLEAKAGAHAPASHVLRAGAFLVVDKFGAAAHELRSLATHK